MEKLSAGVFRYAELPNHRFYFSILKEIGWPFYFRFSFHSTPTASIFYFIVLFKQLLLGILTVYAAIHREVFSRAEEAAALASVRPHRPSLPGRPPQAAHGWRRGDGPCCDLFIKKEGVGQAGDFPPQKFNHF